MPIFPKLTSRELSDLQYDENTQIIDLRPTAAYNGWQLQAEKRGGHIPNAISFPIQWFSDLSQTNCLQILRQKGLTPSKNIILTGYSEEGMESVAQLLEEYGFVSLKTHKAGMQAYLEDEKLSLRSLKRFKQLVHPEWLKAKLELKMPQKSFILAHVSFDNWGDYNDGHIPGAIWLDTLALEDEMTWNHRSPEELEEELCTHGITSDTMVVLYGRTSNPNMSQDQPGQQAGQLASMRAALLLSYAGVRDVRVLDGGVEAWLRAGGELTSEDFAPHAVDSSGLNIPENPQFITLMEKAREYLSASDSELVSVRSWAEFIGEVSGYHYIQRKGRIPGAVFGNCGSDAYHMENYRNHDDTMRSSHEIKVMLAESGLTPDKNLAFYCGTGWRASEAWFCTWLMGWEHVSIFDGGWFEWSNDPDNPYDTGEPE
ncbi:MAG: sulfurtransferase [Candidatus Marinimicrobia bacterium]|nr:sulfurtransferase [Candidatus Neomarinimicrobiota bacterium]